MINTTAGVHIEIEGTPEQCKAFERELPGAIPFPGRIESSQVTQIDPIGETTFRIGASRETERTITPIPPDVAVCPECVKELFDPGNPRYLYPFITCTLCGPRFTVVRAFPYDRERTSMADFTMCPQCEREYHDPPDRRFHSQTNSCPECGPQLSLQDSNGKAIPGDPIVQTARLLHEGRILAIKGIGGFHLACDALNDQAVRVLRERKGREEKPFAVMMPDLPTVKRFCRAGPEEEELLTSPVAPIVLLKALGESVARSVAPFVGTLGVILPYAPLHHLLFRHPEIPVGEEPCVLIMTSGNLSEEPIAAGNQEAVERLSRLADAFLLHNREIVLRADDSISRVIACRPTVFRRSRGLVPAELRIPTKMLAAEPEADQPENPMPAPADGSPDPVILAAGGDMKNALAVLKADRVVPGPHVGDLASPVAQDYFKRSASVLLDYLEADPGVIAVDPHPEYFSNSLGRERGTKVQEIYHHHAHAASLLVEHDMTGPALFAVFDGTGYGTDATIWGGEFLFADLGSFTREGHLGLFQLPGGEAAIREPLRILAGLLAEDWDLPDEFLSLMGDETNHVRYWLEAAKKGINSPFTSSAGRLFDAAAAAAGFTRKVTFEGQAAMWLEGLADPSETGTYDPHFVSDHPVVIDPGSLIVQMARDVIGGSPAAYVAARFHNSVACMVVEAVQRLAARTGTATVGLTGGCFQNRLLTERTSALLERRGFIVLLHANVPPNDGGIAVGQAVSARFCHGKR